MDFFDRQDQAKRRTRIFLAAFAAAVVGTLFGVYLVVSFGFQTIGRVFFSWERPFWDWELLGWTSLVLLLLIGGRILARHLQLRDGGPAVAALLGGRPLPASSSDIGARRLHNVVEEMAIAASLPKPQVYVFDREMGINALTAGFTPDDAVIGVTRGALINLNRDELQGVVGHEFSHILNGDMRLNLWMISFLHGLVGIHELGLRVLRSVWRSDEDNTLWRLGENLAVMGFFLSGTMTVFGFALMIIGYAGHLFARLVQCGLSRQREFLADAAAVQFTRNPSGLASALKKVGGWSRHGLIGHTRAEETAHVFFVDGVTGTLERTFATHPPLEKRVRLLDPSFDGKFPVILDERAARRSQVIRAPEKSEWPPATAGEPVPAGNIQAQAIIATIGQLEAERLHRSQAILEKIPEVLREAVRHPSGAEAAVHLLLLSENSATRAVQFRSLRDNLPDEVAQELLELENPCSALDRESRLAVVELALGALNAFTEMQYRRFRKQLIDLSQIEEEASLHHFCIRKMVIEHLDRRFARSRVPKKKVHSVGSLWPEINRVLSTLAHAGSQDTGIAWRAALTALPPSYHEERPGPAASPEELGKDLDAIRSASPELMKRFLDAAVRCIASDGKAVSDEVELLRAMAAVLHCPIPPLAGRSLESTPTSA